MGRRSAWSRCLDWLLDQDLERRIRSIHTRRNEFGYDPFGFNPEEAKAAALLAKFLYRYYFRVQATGVENIPQGRALLIANHSGQLPFDGVVIGAACLLEMDPPRVVRSMVDRFVPSLPFVSYLFTRWGQIVGTPENCERLLAAEELVLVFPEGSRGISKPFTKRYRLQEFGHGFMRLALAAKAPIVPIAVVGGEEQAPAIDVKPVARLLGVPAFPVVPYPPFFPIVPLPVRYRLYFGSPMRFEGDPDLDDEDIAPMVAEVKATIQTLIHRGLRERKHIFW